MSAARQPQRSLLAKAGGRRQEGRHPPAHRLVMKKAGALRHPALFTPSGRIQAASSRRSRAFT